MKLKNVVIVSLCAVGVLLSSSAVYAVPSSGNNTSVTM